MRKLKVLFLHNRLMHYRLPIWNILAEKCDFTVAYSEGEPFPPEEEKKCKFKILHLPAWKFASRFVIQKANILKLASQYDVLLATGNISWLKNVLYPWNPFRQTPFVYWSLGVSASYDKHYDTNKCWDIPRKVIFNKADACIFYTDYPVEKYAKMGMAREKMFVAHNTVAVLPNVESVKKDSILFIGSLYPQKGLGDLLDVYRKLSKDGVDLPKLNILGKGIEFENIKKFIESNGLGNKIFLRGAIYEIAEKAKYFSRALATISPRQAGLSVQESMGYGVPFITDEDAITGGERFDIIEGETGRYITKTISLESIVKDIAENPQKYENLGKNAYDFYWRDRKPEDMAEGAWRAILYVANLPKWKK